MKNYTYEVIENGYYEETENWQYAIDLFNEAGPLSNQGQSARINVYRLIDTGSRYYVKTLRTHTDIHMWSEELIDNLQANRIERRIMKDLLPKPMSFEYELAALREIEEDERICAEEETLDNHKYNSNDVPTKYNSEDCTPVICFCEPDVTCPQDLDDTVTDFHGDFSGMSDEVKDSIINPKHYKIFSPEDYAEYPDGIEYMDLCDKALAHLSGVESHLVGQILKYTLRVGKKDAMEQDATKIQWYATRLVETVKGK